MYGVNLRGITAMCMLNLIARFDLAWGSGKIHKHEED